LRYDEAITPDGRTPSPELTNDVDELDAQGDEEGLPLCVVGVEEGEAAEVAADVVEVVEQAREVEGRRHRSRCGGNEARQGRVLALDDRRRRDVELEKVGEEGEVEGDDLARHRSALRGTTARDAGRYLVALCTALV
jgi:hypothetical protein